MRVSRIESQASDGAVAPDLVRGEVSASNRKSAKLEDWVVARLDPGVQVRRVGSSTLIVSRAKAQNEPLPLFEEAIVLGNLRAMARSSGTVEADGVTYRGGVASVSVHGPLKSLDVVEMISRFFTLSDVSEVRVRSLQ